MNLKGVNIMNKKIKGSIIAALFGLTVMTGNAFANTESMIIISLVEEETNVNGPNDSRFRTMENVRDIYLMNGTLPGGPAYASGINSTTGTAAVEDKTVDEKIYIEIYDHTNANDNTSANLNTDIRSTVETSGPEPIKALNSLNGRECINILSRIDGQIVKNDAFFVCQRFKWN